MDRNACLAAQNILTIDQAVAVLESMDPGIYTRAVLGPRSGSLGGQFRHCIDYLTCFLRDLESRRIDYDRRERDPLVERQPLRAAERLREIADRLATMPSSQARRELEIKADRMGAGVAGSSASVWCGSTVERELLFLLSHTVHHFALISLMLKIQGVESPAGFGVAPSTLEHRKDSAECAP